MNVDRMTIEFHTDGFDSGAAVRCAQLHDIASSGVPAFVDGIHIRSGEARDLLERFFYDVDDAERYTHMRRDVTCLQSQLAFETERARIRDEMARDSLATAA